MATTEQDQVGFLVKVGTYILGIILGLAAKLVVVNKEKPLTIREFVYHSAIAFAAAWMVWALLSHYQYTHLANIVSVIVGRYGDIILIAGYKHTLEFIKSLNPKGK